MANCWEDVEELFLTNAACDLEVADEIHPMLAAFSGDDPRFLAWLRPFPKGAYHDPLIELLALAAPLDADRLALSIAARVWSLRDPVPPVTADADLRQRVLIIHQVDGARGRPRAVSLFHPFAVTEEGVAWDPRRRMEGGEGWIFDAMEPAIARRARLRVPDEQIAEQAARVAALGHSLYLEPGLAARLSVAAAPSGGEDSARRGWRAHRRFPHHARARRVPAPRRGWPPP